jgi:hypothetical protein
LFEASYVVLAFARAPEELPTIILDIHGDLWKNSMVCGVGSRRLIAMRLCQGVLEEKGPRV